jgi:DNA-3-methyladenine glycosylase
VTPARGGSDPTPAPAADGAVLPAAFYDRPVTAVAADLVGAVVATSDGRRARIVEVEAYGGGDDPGSHAYRGPTPRTTAMRGPPGHLYVYFTYGMHWCANAVCGPCGSAAAVLIRAAEPLTGLEAMRRARWGSGPDRADRDLCRGPGRLARALGIDGTLDGADLTAALGAPGRPGTGRSPGAPAGRVAVLARTGPARRLATTTRVGLRAGAERPWRFVEAGSPWVSGPRPQAP